MTAFDPRTREYTVKALAEVAAAEAAAAEAAAAVEAVAAAEAAAAVESATAAGGAPRKPPPMRLARKRLYRPSCRKSLAAARAAWPRTPRRSPGGQRN